MGYIPTVTQCPEPQASQGTCSSASQIGTVTVAAGSGSPFTFPGKVYLTGPYAGAPFGLSIVVPPNAGPFSLPPVIARAKIEVKSDTAQVVASDPNIPRIVGGIPIRIRALNIVIDRQGFERNPTNCSVFATESVVGGFTPGGASASATLSTPFQVAGLQHARVQTVVLGEHGRQTVAPERREPRNDDQPAAGRGGHQVGARARCPSSCRRG